MIMRNASLAVWLLTLAACGSLGDGGVDAPSDAADLADLGGSGVSASSDVMTLKAVGASSGSCAVYGDSGRLLGSGAPDAVAYQVGMEEAAIVTCGGSSAVFQIGVEQVMLTGTSTNVADRLKGTVMGKGTLMLASAMADVLDGDAAANISAATAKSVYKAGGGGNPVADALTEIASALSTIQNPTDSAALKTAIIQLLVNSGEPVVIENVGAGRTLSACSDAAAATFSSQAKTADASVVGLTGCLVYHGLDATTDLNNPLGAPANNVPSSFRSVARETQVVQQLLDSFTDNRYFTGASVGTFIFSTAGHPAYTEDDEGVITSQTVASADFSTAMGALIPMLSTSTDLSLMRFHTGFNPSGGWEVNVAAALQTLPDACMDSNPSTACPVSPIYFDFDGTTLTQNAAGGYILELLYSAGGFLNSAYVLDKTTGRPYRNALYEVAQPTIDPSAYSAIDYANPLYQVALNPMQDGSGNSAPFANADWRAVYPAMGNVDNAYAFPAPEVTARQVAVLALAANMSRLPALQALMLEKFATRGSAALLIGGNSILLSDHGRTISAWEGLANTWLASGTKAAKVTAGGSQNIKTGVFKVNSATCKNGAGTTVPCTIASTIRLNQTGVTQPDGSTRFSVTSGNLTITSAATVGTVTYTPLYLSVNAAANSAQLLGDLNLGHSFTGSNLKNKITGGNSTNSTYSMTAYGN